MPGLPVSSRLRSPADRPKPVHTALRIPHHGSHHAGIPRHQGPSAELRSISPASRPLPWKMSGDWGVKESSHAQTRDKADSKIYTDWANHYLARSGHKRLIKDLQQDVADGVLLAEIIQIIANEKVEDINSCPRSQAQMIENVDACLSFLAVRGVHIQSLSAEEIRDGNLKAILGLFFSLSRYKQQQQQQQELSEFQQQAQPQSSGISSPSHQRAPLDMQSSLVSGHTSQSKQSGNAVNQRKASRLPGPSRVPAAGSATKVQGANNLNRRSQSFNTIDKNKALQYAGSCERVSETAKGAAAPGGMNGTVATAANSGHQPASAIPSPSSGKPWRSKSMNVKHTATSPMLSVKPPSPATSPTAPADRSRVPYPETPKATGGEQRSMLEKFKLINSRTAPRQPGHQAALPAEGARDEGLLSEGGEVEGAGGGSPKAQSKGPCQRTGSKAPCQKKPGGAPAKEEREKEKGKGPKVAKDEKGGETPRKSSKIASLIPKGGKSAGVKKESAIPASSGIPKPGSKMATGKTPTVAVPTGAKDPEKAKSTKGSPSHCLPKAPGDNKASGPSDGRGAALPSSPPSSSNATGVSGGHTAGTANAHVYLPQSQQQYNHPNTATVAPFLYKTHSDNDGSSLLSGDISGSHTKLDSVYSKTAKQCLEEISGR